LKYKNSKVVKFTSLRDMILEDAPPVHVHNPKKDKRKHGGIVVSESHTKECKVAFKKRRLMDNFDSLAYGYLLFIYLFIYLFTNRGALTHHNSFHSVTLKLQHPFTRIVAGPSSCGKSTFVIRLLECSEQLCDIVFTNIVLCYSENNAPHHLKNVTFVKGVPDFENPENGPTHIVLDYLMDSNYSTKVSQ